MVEAGDEKIYQTRQSLLKWYREHRRPLPWRAHSDPYLIWISEVMLQQTTVQAVIPFYERFIERFPTVHSLAESTIEDVYEYWAGLGYYSRARNLHKAAGELSASGFPKSYEQLLKMPGFGPYTSRAVSSLAFGEKVGVVDGNVIRVLSRLFDKPFEWWKTKDKNELQLISDSLAKTKHVKDLNQAIMELGATVCTPKSPACLLCPVSQLCKGFELNNHFDLPIKKPKKQKEIWHWDIQVANDKGKIAFAKESYTPFLKNYSLFPGSVKKLKSPPKTFDYKHMVTHYEIYVSVNSVSKAKLKKSAGPFNWISKKQIQRNIPLSIVNKALEISDKQTT